jgi:hypothetical protein
VFGREEIEAALRIPFARLSSAFSRFNRFTSSDSSVVTTGHRRVSTSVCRHHFLTVSGVPIPQQLGDLAHRRPVRLMIGTALAEHPDRPLTQLRLSLRCASSHDFNFPATESPDTPG